MQSLPGKPPCIGIACFVVPPGEICGFALTVKFIADNRGADGGTVNSNLMGPAGDRLQGYQGILPG